MVELQRKNKCSNVDEIRVNSRFVYEALIDQYAGGREELDEVLETLKRRASDPDKVVDIYFGAVISEYRRIYDQARIKNLVRLFRDSALVRASVDVIGRYQSTLDNELYKAMRALREAQNWRMTRNALVAECVDDRDTKG